MASVTPGMRIASWAICLLSLVLVFVASVLPRLLGADPFLVTSELGLMAWLVASSVLGLILVLRARAVPMGALMLAIGLGGAMAALGNAIPMDPSNIAWLPLIAISGAGWVTFLGLTIGGLPLLFPTGSPPSPRWRPVLWLLLGLLAFAVFLSAFSAEMTVFCSDVSPGDANCQSWETSDEPLAIENCAPVAGPLGDGTECQVTLQNPIGISWVPPVEDSLAGNIGYGGLLITAGLAIVSLGVRMRRAGSQERQQIKLVFFVLGALVGTTLAEVLVVEALGASLPGYGLVEFLMWVAIPIAIFLAITRYRLYEIDRLISRTVSYAVVVGLLAGAVAIVATLVGTRFTQPLVVATTTLGVAAVFNPLRGRVQAGVDRRFNRSKYDAERVISEYSESLRSALELDALVDGWREVVTDTMQPATLSVWMRS